MRALAFLEFLPTVCHSSSISGLCCTCGAYEYRFDSYRCDIWEYAQFGRWNRVGRLLDVVVRVHMLPPIKRTWFLFYMQSRHLRCLTVSSLNITVPNKWEWLSEVVALITQQKVVRLHSFPPIWSAVGCPRTTTWSIPMRQNRLYKRDRVCYFV